MKRTLSRIAITALLLSSVLLSACHGDRPEPFLDKEQMISLLADIRLAESQLYNNRETDPKISDKVMEQRALDVYVPIFKEYGINYQQYQNLLTYYMNHPDDLEEIMQEVAKYPATHVVITGGEPALQLTPSLVSKLHSAGKYVQIETNGTVRLPDGCCVDWVTCSPKYRPVELAHIDELKVVFTSSEQDMAQYDGYLAAVYCLQPCDVGDPKANARILGEAIDYCLAHPKWRLSLQTHKMINVR